MFCREEKMQSKFQAAHKLWATVVLLSIIALTAALRIRLLEVPLDRDEGGYGYTAQLILQGVPPFAHAYDMKMPGLYYVYALILLVFGQTTIGIHLGLLVINSVTIVLLYLIGKRLFDTTVGITAAAAYAVMSLSQAVWGFSTNAEYLLLAPALAGILLLLRGLDSSRIGYFFGGGLLLGTAFIIKHQGIFFAGFAAFYLFLCVLKKPKNQRNRCIRQYLFFLLGLTIPFSVLCLYFWIIGLFDKFWFWLFKYPQEYAYRISFQQGVEFFVNQIARMAPSAIGLWLLAAVGLIALLRKKHLRHRLLFMVLFFLFSLLALVPGYYFYPHYFVLILPVLAILTGLGADSTAALLKNSRSSIIKAVLPILLVAAAIVYALIAEKAYLFELTPAAISRAAFGLNPFPESVKIADYIKNNSRPGDEVAIIGSEPQIFFYTRCRSATSHIYIYPLVGSHKYASSMQQEMIHQIEAAQPHFLIFVYIPDSWLMDKKSDRSILNWSQDYIKAQYTFVGTVNILLDGTSIYNWSPDAAKNKPPSDYWIAVFERKTPEGGSPPPDSPKRWIPPARL
jgi:4-amino-4-deoxy-L-arabinose transferase-like glycosyltransferase